MPASVYDAHDRDDLRINLVVHGIWKTGEQHTSQSAMNDGVTQRRFLDRLDCGIDSGKKTLSCAWRPAKIPRESGVDFCSR
jgi:hypothetical protein